ncbi:MAG: L,D-transpeptidase [Pseudotabrizicola sp.]|uniref:L,D-transpeptidase n=1 Tax=Pseudotabrizicola sp. TaxID=2939647 RepID=UPI002719F495|nr:L,D-transpeptidase [Pseudotabrizicola sp.]MDO8884897.1 L,D-transpeptidase [Pseudotabrizicola sp.]MDP2081327.1 L,D-transpeptidase [Pseudotabrizicola sp.]MDZ7576054.1 L,D-transpeptidase [Pseudotabrizicola sp.]
MPFPRTRRYVLKLGAATMASLACPALVYAQDTTVIAPADSTGSPSRHNTASFRVHHWEDHFPNLQKGAILCDLESRALHYWPEDDSQHLIFPSSVPRSEELTQTGLTEIVLKRRNPTWIPTPNMRALDPTLPESIGPGPDNPMGSRALNLGWQYYRIHGIDDIAKIGRPASSGCVGLFNDHVEHLFELVEVGTQVRFL